jgi:predicted kinase
MKHELLAAVLPLAIEALESHIAAALDEGSVPVIDAVETVRLLRALVSGAREYHVNVESVQRRLSRMQASVENPVARTRACAIEVHWAPASGGPDAG